MSLLHSRLSISDVSPTLITLSNDDPKVNCTIQVQNLGTDAVYIGGEGLTSTSYGASIVPGGALTIDNLAPKDEVYALSANGSSYVGVLRISR